MVLILDSSTYKYHLLKILIYLHFAQLLTNLLTYLLIPWRTVVLEKLTGSQVVKKFPAF